MRQVGCVFLLVLVALLTACAAEPRRSAEPLVTRPSVESFAQWMALPAQGRQREFFVGDHRDGYYSGMTASHRGGPGWFLGEHRIWQDAVAWAGEVALHRDKPASDEWVLPWGRRSSLGALQEDWTFHGNSRRLSIAVRSAEPALLAVQPLWVDRSARPRTSDGVVLLNDQRSGWVAALAASAPFDLEDPPSTAADPSPLLRARAATQDFVVHLAFSRSIEAAIRDVRAMVADPELSRRSHAALHARLTRAWLTTGDETYDRALAWARVSSLLFEVHEPEHGLWAGLPWFRENWGRDTFIALPGTFLVNGHFDSAAAVLAHFARWQNLTPPKAEAKAPGSADRLGIGPRTSDYGRVPNFVKHGVAFYNTVDATPWLLREALELARYSGDKNLARRALRIAGPYIDGVQRHSLDASGLLLHDDADTWMDARIDGREAWSPRGSRAVEVQALWYTALQSAAELAETAGQTQRAAEWRAQAQRSRAAFLRHFVVDGRLADRLRADGSPDLTRRPNALLAITVPWDDYLPLALQDAVLRDAVEHLLFPYGIASLAPEETWFHPRHVDDARHHKDAAYHNGTIWGWNAGFVVSALQRHGYSDLAWQLSRNLAEQILHLGAMGTMSELLDALPGPDGRPVPSGTPAQSWSVAEFSRNAFQDYVGFRPDLLRGVLRLAPALPSGWRHFDARLPFGPETIDEALSIAARRIDGESWRWQIGVENASKKRVVEIDWMDRAGAVKRARFDLMPGRTAHLELTDTTLRLDGVPLKTRVVRAPIGAGFAPLRFRQVPPNDPQQYPMTRGTDVLRSIRLKEANRR